MHFPMPDTVERLAKALPDEYAVQRELGRGGMAIVFLAEDVKHHRLVAIKVLRPEVSQHLGAERFLREIEIASQLQHPHILPLFDSGESQGVLYYVMPFVEGESLRERLKRERQLPLGDALRIASDVADALSYAHSRGIVHRDIKPENILLAGEEAIVADFGIARAVSVAAGDRLTESGIAVGTPYYMSPEQADPGGNLDGRSDVYSLGCVLYEMLVGEPPYTGPDVHAVLARHMAASVPSIRVSRETVPVPVEEAVRQALAKVPADRFRTAGQFAAALRDPAFTSQLPVTSARGGRRWPLVAAGAGVLALSGSLLWSRAHRDSLDLAMFAVLPDRKSVV